MSKARKQNLNDPHKKVKSEPEMSSSFAFPSSLRKVPNNPSQVNSQEMLGEALKSSFLDFKIQHLVEVYMIMYISRVAMQRGQRALTKVIRH